MKIHPLKTWPKYFAMGEVDQWETKKPWEVRRDDRGFKVGDVVILQEWDPEPETQGYTGQFIVGKITNVLRYDDVPGIEPGYCVFGYQYLHGEVKGKPKGEKQCSCCGDS